MASEKVIKDNFAWYTNPNLKVILGKLPKEDISNLEKCAQKLTKDEIGCDVYLTRTPRHLPVKLIGKLNNSFIQGKLSGMPNPVHRRRSKHAVELHRILARIDWLLHALPHPVDKFKCLKYWVRE